MNPTWEYNFYDLNAIDNYIKQHESDNVYKAFKKINPKFGAAITDMFRYIVMYHEGCVYMDIKSKTNIPLDEWVHTQKLNISTFGDYNYYNDKLINKKYYKKCDKDIKYDLAQFILIFPKKYPILRILIDEIVKKIESFEDNYLLKLIIGNKYYNGYNIFKTTGPYIFNKIFGPHVCNNDNVILYDCDGLINAYNGNIIYDGTNGKYHMEQLKKNTHYLTQKDKFII